jgi:purine-binding chemotaxis protein CheW
MKLDYEQESEKKTGDVQRYLSFSLGHEDYAVPLLGVREVIAVPEITPVPYTPPHFLGIMNLRGQVISIIDLRLKFNIKAETTSETAVIICDIGTSSLGVVISSVNSVLALDAADISPKPEIQSYKNTDYITGVTRRDKKLILLLDLTKALSVEEHAAISKAAGVKKAA